MDLLALACLRRHYTCATKWQCMLTSAPAVTMYHSPICRGEQSIGEVGTSGAKWQATTTPLHALARSARMCTRVQLAFIHVSHTYACELLMCVHMRAAHVAFNVFTQAHACSNPKLHLLNHSYLSSCIALIGAFVFVISKF